MAQEGRGKRVLEGGSRRKKDAFFWHVACRASRLKTKVTGKKKKRFKKKEVGRGGNKKKGGDRQQGSNADEKNEGEGLTGP